MPSRVVLCCAALTLAAGCGTTVSGTTAISGGGGGLGSGPSSNSTSSLSTTNGATGANAPTGGVGSTQAQSPTASGGSSSAGVAGGSSAGAATVPSHAPGVTGTAIYIGVEYCSSCGTEDGVIGAAGAAPSYDYRNVFNAMANYANTHGGLAGRKLVPIYYDYNATTDVSAQDQAACANWTQDHKVFAIFGAPATDDILRSCAEHEGGISLSTGGAEIGTTFQKYPHYLDLVGLALDKLATVTVNGLSHAGYFTGKLGLVTWDDPAYHYAVSNGYTPALAAHHLQAADTAYISVPQQLNALTDTSAAISSAVTKFKTEGIDHVIVQDGPAGVFGGTGLTLEWMDQAKSQNYYPRYGQNSGNSPGWDVLPSDEMDKALAVDQTDIDTTRDVGWHTNTTRERCYKIEAAAGYPVSPSNLNDEVFAGASCDVVWFLQRMIGQLQAIDSTALINQAAKLGTSFASSEVYGTKLTASLHGGGGMVRTEQYLASCQCLRYQGTPYYAD